MKRDSIMKVRVNSEEKTRYKAALAEGGKDFSEFARAALERYTRRVEKAANAATSNEGKIR